MLTRSSPNFFQVFFPFEISYNSSSYSFNQNPSIVKGDPGQKVTLKEEEITFLCLKVQDIFLAQPTLLRLKAPINVCGLRFFFIFFFDFFSKLINQLYFIVFIL